MNDAIPICRSVFKHWIYDDAEFLKTWITMLGRAQFTPEPKNCLYMGISYTLHRGEFVFGRKKWCKDTGISEERLRRLITLMVKDNMISVVVFKGKFTIYKVVNYEKFNHVEKHKTKGVKPDSPPTDTPTEAPTEPQQTPQQTTTNEEGTKKVKNDKKDKEDTYDYFADFWKEYPRKVAKADAVKAFAKLKMNDELMEVLMAGLYRATASESWLKDGGKFIPYPASWLNGRRWEDGH